MNDARTAHDFIHPRLPASFELSTALLATCHALGHLVGNANAHLADGREPDHFVANGGFAGREVGVDAEQLRGGGGERVEGGGDARGEVGVRE